MKSKHLFIVTLLVLVGAFILAPIARAEIGNGEKIHRYFVKAKVLAEILSAPQVRIVDCRRSVEDYHKGHIPGAVYLNVLKKLRVAGRGGVPGVRRMIEEQEELFGRDLGINNDSMVILYDDSGLDATRLLWELTVAGHERVAILYGGWEEWIKNKLPQETETPNIVPQAFVGQCNCDSLATANYILANLGNPDVVIADCRPPEQFLGKKKHPKAACAGRIPGAVNTYALVNWENKTYPKPPEELEAMFEDLGITRDKTIVVYCNSGYMGANSWFILKALGYPDVKCYDYSWLEWSRKDHLPKVKPNM